MYAAIAEGEPSAIRSHRRCDGTHMTDFLIWRGLATWSFQQSPQGGRGRDANAPAPHWPGNGSGAEP